MPAPATRPSARLLASALLLLAPVSAPAARIRDLGVRPGRYEPGPKNAITDVAGVRVGHKTLVKGEGKLVPGKGPVRTGVTVILPPGDFWNRKLPAGSFILNGNGEATGLMWIEEQGALETPIALTNTLGVSDVHRGLVDWMLETYPDVGIGDDTVVPVVLECDDSSLSDIRGRHVKPAHVAEAIRAASDGPVAEGAVGAGTGMISYDFKGGIGTSSRVLPPESGGRWTVGVLVNANHGDRHTLRVGGVPAGERITDLMPEMKREGSIVLIVATDAPLLSRQLKRLAKRVMLGLARTGAVAHHGSGDVALAFSTANRVPHYPKEPLVKIEALSDAWLDPLFEAAADAAEEAVLNALAAAETVTGRDGNTAHALPLGRLRELLAE